MRTKRSTLVILICTMAAILSMAILLTFPPKAARRRTDAQGPDTKEPVVSYSEIRVRITDNDYRHWYASGHHYTADVNVVSDEYELEYGTHLTNMDAMEMEGYDVGDVINAEMTTWTMQETGEIVRREITKIRS